MQNILLALHLLIAIALVGVVLLQRSEGGALGMGGQSSGGAGMFSARGAASMLTRATAFLAACFIATSLGLALVAKGGREGESILDRPLPATATEAPAEGSEEPQVPLSR